MTETLKRRSLLADLDAASTPVDEAAITATAGRHGFLQGQGGGAQGGPEAARRRRQPTGRVHQLNVRLRADTIGLIYAQANDRNIPVAQVIEEAMDALARTAAPREPS